MSSSDIAKKIFSDALEASLPKNFILDYCKLNANILSIGEDEYDLDTYKNIYVFGSGKASYSMALEIEKLLDKRIYKGLVVSPKVDNKLKYIQVSEGSHPYPDEKSFNSAKSLVQMMQECQSDDLYIYLLSGGSSALIELPIEPISLEDFQDATQIMLHNALEVQEINVVRKHISKIKGGRLAEICKARGVVLVVSDIIDNDLYSIGSAPLYLDKSTFSEAKNILEAKDIFYIMPQSVREILEKGLSGLVEETPKTENQNVKHYILASNSLALDAAYKSAITQGLSTKVVNATMQGDVKSMVQIFLKTLNKSDEKCILFGGECTVKVEGNGQGGRNQHAVALMLQEICERDLDICFLSASTDGVDGNSDAAGGVVDKESCQKISKDEMQRYVKNFDSQNLLKEIDGLVMTGPSGTNVIDIAIIIKGD